MIRIKSPKEIDYMRRSCRLGAETLQFAGQLVAPGVTTREIDRKVLEFILDHGAYPSPLNYPGKPTDPRRPRIDPGCFPASICTSVNNVVTHGIPDDRPLQSGDIVNIDITVLLDGYHGDCSAMFFVGEPSAEAERLVETTRRALLAGIAAAVEGALLGDIGNAIQDVADEAGYGVVREYCGHGIGRRFHEEPMVLHYRTDKPGPRLKRGMVFTIEPMINAGGWKTRTLSDNWTSVTADGSLSAQFEHTIALTENGTEILTEVG